MKQLTFEQAKTFILIKQGLLGDYQFEGKQGVMSLITQVGSLQFDPIDICGRSADITLFSGVKDYDKSFLEELLYKDRLLVDQWDKVTSIYSLSDWPYFRRIRNDIIYEKLISEHKLLIPSVMRLIKELAYFDSSVVKSLLPLNSHKRLSENILDYLFFKGDIIVDHKKGVKKFYTLTEKHIN